MKYIKNIRIQNLGNIKDLEVKNLSPLSVFIPVKNEDHLSPVDLLYLLSQWAKRQIDTEYEKDDILVETKLEPYGIKCNWLADIEVSVMDTNKQSSSNYKGLIHNNIFADDTLDPLLLVLQDLHFIPSWVEIRNRHPRNMHNYVHEQRNRTKDTQSLWETMSPDLVDEIAPENLFRMPTKKDILEGKPIVIQPFSEHTDAKNLYEEGTKMGYMWRNAYLDN